MEHNYSDEMYVIMDEMNARIEDLVNSVDDDGKLELVVQKLHEKSLEFIDDLAQEIEKLALIEMEAY